MMMMMMTSMRFSVLAWRIWIYIRILVLEFLRRLSFRPSRFVSRPNDRHLPPLQARVDALSSLTLEPGSVGAFFRRIGRRGVRNEDADGSATIT